MSERAHPDDRGFRPGSKYYQSMVHNYEFCLPYTKGKRVLDVPCGTGWGTSIISNAEEVVGVDICPEAISYAKQHFIAGPRFNYVVGDMARLTFPAHRFDAVLCLEGFEHIDQSAGLSFLGEASRVLRPDGIMIMTCPILNDLGKHSGNKYHISEYEGRALVTLLNMSFDILRLDKIAGPDGPEYRAVLANRP